MTKEFVPYEQALELKELGFDEPCFGYYNIKDNNLKLFSNELVDASCNSDLKYDDFKHCTVPTFSQAFRWFREKYKLDSFVKHLYKSTIKVGYYFGIDEYKGIEFQLDLDDYYKTYEEAELACLIKLIEIVKTK